MTVRQIKLMFSEQEYLKAMNYNTIELKQQIREELLEQFKEERESFSH
jgi:hypothetical protein